jgi:O-methyltransferase involved in polyketide biosynthesis
MIMATTETVKKSGDVGLTAMAVAYQRTLSDIPYTKRIFNAAERISASNGGPELPKAMYKINAARMEARYKLISKLIMETGTTQILEIASGLSPRGISTVGPGGISYVETDLPGMIKLKRAILEGIKKPLPKALHLTPADALSRTELKKAASIFAPDRPITVVNEGLLLYLDRNQRIAVAGNVKHLLRTFGGEWITTDIYLEKVRRKRTEKDASYVKAVTQLSGVDINRNRYKDLNAAIRFFESLGLLVEVRKFTEVTGELKSPKKIGLSRKELEDRMSSGVAFVMRIKEN